ncbi:tRNA(Arg) A34 adenosine deaminase TadA [Leucobacter luti]|uniref:nucleoside deaminase n=1 Tax=Leucobacter luti TaxID=340320 RepID=UPI0010453F62|nr:nucleoside deaminase [Leucobacter luti]MCW2289000.1 tRNA(Arg) A34 adenosine deaminase TadA [Leucobacter luti]TCK44852.1 tRNA(Arg) A34 adenosine deaminase TadA [Leucobacter luti]
MSTSLAPTLIDNEMRLLRRAIEIGHEARQAGRHPFGALVTDSVGNIVAERGNNSVPPDGDPTQHAELAAAAAAFRELGAEGMVGSTLFTSAEPCAMCTGAAYWTGIGKIVYALSEERLLELTGDDPENPTFALPCREVVARGQREIEVVGPLLEDDAAADHQGFWSL